MNDFVAIGLVIAVILFGAFGYLVLMILFPESVGIQGEIAKKHRKEHEQVSEEPSSGDPP